LVEQAVREACAELGYTNIQLPVKPQPGADAQGGQGGKAKNGVGQKGKKKDGAGKEGKEKRPRAITAYQVFMTLALVSGWC
jgi:hypothetical protein